MRQPALLIDLFRKHFNNEFDRCITLSDETGVLFPISAIALKCL